MSYDVEFKSAAISDLESLGSASQKRVLKKIRWLSENFETLTPQALTGNLVGLFKLRAGDYRVIYSFSVEAQLITIHRAGHRRDIYL